MELLTPKTQAYIYGGEWVGDCPREGCANVEYLWTPVYPNGPRIQPRGFYICSHCGIQGTIEWPPQDFMVAALSVLMERPIPDTRNWYPKDHDVATRFRIPHGQSVKDLQDENREHGVVTV